RAFGLAPGRAGWKENALRPPAGMSEIALSVDRPSEETSFQAAGRRTPESGPARRADWRLGGEYMRRAGANNERTTARVIGLPKRSPFCRRRTGPCSSVSG